MRSCSGPSRSSPRDTESSGRRPGKRISRRSGERRIPAPDGHCRPVRPVQPTRTTTKTISDSSCATTSSLGLSIQMPIFNGTTGARVARSRQDASEARYKLESLKSDLRLEIQRGLGALRIARGAVDLRRSDVECRARNAESQRDSYGSRPHRRKGSGGVARPAAAKRAVASRCRPGAISAQTGACCIRPEPLRPRFSSSAVHSQDIPCIALRCLSRTAPMHFISCRIVSLTQARI